MSFQPNALAGILAPINPDTKAFYRRGTNAVIRETIDTDFCRDNNVAVATTGVMFSQSILLYQGDVITKLAMRTGTQAAVTPTHWWFALYDNQVTPNLLAQTADQTSTAWGSATIMDLSLTGGPFTMANTGLYWISLMMTAATIVNLTGQGTASSVSSGGYIAGMVPRSQTSGSALTTTAPATITGGAASASSIYAIAH